MNVLLFAGTGDGRELAERIADLPARLAVDLTVSVATDYGLDCLRGFPARVTRLAGRLARPELERLLSDKHFDILIDATHPYAREVRRTIREAAEAVGVKRLRLRRERGGDGEFATAATAEEAAARLTETEGNILLTTGSKDLAVFAAAPGLTRRLYPRVLPTVEALEECARAGIARQNIIAMQGPFSRELNIALMRQCAIRVLVTKDGGAVGGFEEKLAAARDAGVSVLVIARPEDDDEGMDAEDIIRAVQSLAEAATCA